MQKFSSFFFFNFSHSCLKRTIDTTIVVCFVILKMICCFFFLFHRRLPQLLTCNFSEISYALHAITYGRSEERVEKWSDSHAYFFFILLHFQQLIESERARAHFIMLSCFLPIHRLSLEIRKSSDFCVSGTLKYSADSSHLIIRSLVV